MDGAGVHTQFKIRLSYYRLWKISSTYVSRSNTDKGYKYRLEALEVLVSIVYDISLVDTQLADSIWYSSENDVNKPI